MKQILLVEDDKRLGPTVKKGLEELGFAVALAADAKRMWSLLQQSPVPEMVILDLGLPDADGIELLQSMRAQSYTQPVLILTARGGLTDRVLGLDAGADDYLPKPFSFTELAARVRALSRRIQEPAMVITIEELRIDLAARRVHLAGEPVELTPREFDFLAYLGQRVDQVVTRAMLVEHVWREPNRFTSLDNVIDVHVSRLRRKITSATGWCPLQVVRGLGIMLKGSA